MSTRTLGEAQVLGLRLFLEGLEVPVISATVDINEGAAAVAQIEIVGLDSAMKFKPRTVVHLFFFDGADYKYGPKTATTTTGGVRTDPGNPFSSLTPVKEETTKLGIDDRYRLLFMGELFSYSYQKSGSGARSIILNCIDFSNYWDTSFIFQVSGSDESLLDIPQVQPFITGSDVFANTVVEGGNVGLLLGQLSTTSGGPQLSQSILPGAKVEFLSSLMGVLELLGGVSVIDDSKPPDPKAEAPEYTRYSVHGGMSPWHTISERRVRLLDQIATDDGKTAATMFKQEKFEEFLRKQSDLTNSVLSFRDILNLLLGHVFYSTFPNPCGRLLTKEPVSFHDPGVGDMTRNSFKVPAYTAPTNLPLDLKFLPPDIVTTVDLAKSRQLFNTQSPTAVPEYLSKNFTLTQLTASKSHPSLVRKNKIEAEAVYNFLRDLCLYLLEPIKAQYSSYTITVTSAFRGPDLNAAVGGSPTSQHLSGQAADLDFGSKNNNWEVFKWIAFVSQLPFGQVIFECDKSGGTWVHVSLGSPWAYFAEDKRRMYGRYDTGVNKVVVMRIPLTWDISTPLPST